MEFDEDGNELDPDLLLDMPSGHDNGLGGLGGHFEDELEGSTLEDQLRGMDGMDEPTPVKRRTSNHVPESSRYSLAFELASAMDPATSSSNLFAELGIEEAPEEAEQAYDETQEEPVDPEALNGHSAAVEADNGTSSVSINRTPIRKAKSRASHASLRDSLSARAALTSRTSPPSFHTGFSDQQSEDEDSANAAVFQGNTTALQTSISTTETFLEHLRQQNATLDTIASQTTPPQSSYHDRQPFIEKLATDLIKAIYEMAKRREEELKELKETEKAFSDQDPAWQGILAELDPMPIFSTTKSSTTFGGKDRLATFSEEDEVESSANLPHSPVSPPSQLVPGELANLRIWTDSYITSLGAVAEHNQVSKATNTDASRKLKSLESAVGRLRSETESLEKSQAFIRNYEAQELKDAQNGGLRQTALPGLSGPRTRKSSNNNNKSASSNGSQISSGKFSAQVRGEMKAAISLLESSHERAKMLLTPS